MFRQIIMNIIYLIGGKAVVQLFCSSNKGNKTNKIVIKPKMATNTPIPTKNKWLYTTDNFGKLENGVVYYSETL